MVVTCKGDERRTVQQVSRLWKFRMNSHDQWTLTSQVVVRWAACEVLVASVLRVVAWLFVFVSLVRHFPSRWRCCCRRKSYFSDNPLQETVTMLTSRIQTWL